MSGLLIPSMANIVSWAKLALLVAVYGYKLIKYLREHYANTEKDAQDVTPPGIMSSEKKAELWNRRASNDILDLKKRAPGRSELNYLREKVWKAENPGKTPKALRDPKLRIKHRKGKAR